MSRITALLILCGATWLSAAAPTRPEILKPEPPLSPKRVAVADVLREGYVLPTTGSVVFPLRGEVHCEELVFEFGLNGELPRDIRDAVLEINCDQVGLEARLPLQASRDETVRQWSRATIPFKDPPEGCNISFAIKGLEDSPNAHPVLCYPRLARHVPDRKRPDIILIVCDTLRRDYLSLYRSPFVNTPAFDRLGNESVVFEEAYTGIPITQPSHFCMLSGLYPSQSGLINNSMIPPPDVQTLPVLLKGLGYRTASIASVFALKEEWGLGPGFDEYIDANEVPRDRMPEAIRAWLRQDVGDPVFLLINFDHPHSPRKPPRGTPLLKVRFEGGGERVLAVSDYELKEIPVLLQPGKNRFIFEALEDTTLPEDLRSFDKLSYDLGFAGCREPKAANPHREFEIQYGPEWNRLIFEGSGSIEVLNPLSDPVFATLSFQAYRTLGIEVNNERYRRSVQDADRYMRRVLEVLEETDVLKNAIIVVTSDHGEGLYAHGVGGHIQGVFSQQVRIPFYVRVPGIAPRRSSHRVHLVDLFPTLLESLELDPGGDYPGRSFLNVLEGKEEEKLERWLFSASYPPMSHVLRYGLRNEKWSYVRDRKKEYLFDIGSQGVDWMDGESVADTQPEILKKMSEYLDRFVDSLGEPGKGAINADLSEEEMEKMRALGYMR